jgi:hypothetical protein
MLSSFVFSSSAPGTWEEILMSIVLNSDVFGVNGCVVTTVPFDAHPTIKSAATNRMKIFVFITTSQILILNRLENNKKIIFCQLKKKYFSRGG